MRTRTAALAAAAVTNTVAAAAVVLKAGQWRLYADRHRIEPQPLRSCPDCRGAGGWWVGDPDPAMEECGCWAYRPQRHIRLLPVPAWPDEPPF
ncbi:hypothetical protein ABZ650_22840 [Streptomyces griseoviridis]|uniref:hypothetical protein n=1 Tax=Streptomyces griseoviridis TaxID=45398 RepID=UPI0033FE9245